MANPILAETKRKNLIRIMAARGLKNKDLADMMGVSQAHISNLLSDPSSPNNRGIGDKTIEKLCEVLDVDEIEFYMGLWDGKIENNPHDSDIISIPEPFRSVIKDVLEILTSGDETTAMALLQNIKAFHASIRRVHEIAALKRISCGTHRFTADGCWL